MQSISPSTSGALNKNKKRDTLKKMLAALVGEQPINGHVSKFELSNYNLGSSTNHM